MLHNLANFSWNFPASHMNKLEQSHNGEMHL